MAGHVSGWFICSVTIQVMTEPRNYDQQNQRINHYTQHVHSFVVLSVHRQTDVKSKKYKMQRCKKTEGLRSFIPSTYYTEFCKKGSVKPTKSELTVSIILLIS